MGSTARTISRGGHRRYACLLRRQCSLPASLCLPKWRKCGLLAVFCPPWSRTEASEKPAKRAERCLQNKWKVADDEDGSEEAGDPEQNLPAPARTLSHPLDFHEEVCSHRSPTTNLAYDPATYWAVIVV